MDEQLTPTISNLTERRIPSFGFVVPWAIVLIGFVSATQIVRLIIAKFDFRIFLNEKFAFSINLPLPIIYVLYFLVFGLIFYYLVRYWKSLILSSRLGFVLILSGGLANLLERIYFGHVTDYIFLLNGVLNIADFYIFLGAVLVIASRNNSEKI